MRSTSLILASCLALLATACGKKGPAPAPPAATAPATAPTDASTPAPAPAPDAASAPTPDAAPTPAPAPTETTEVVLWHSYRAGEQEAFDKVVDTFNNSQKEVLIRSQAIPYDPFVDKITITVPRGQGPDLFIFAHNMVGNWVEKGVLEPLSGKVDGEVLKQYMPQSVKALVYRKNLYGLPMAFKSLVMFYNKKLLPEPPATMEELVAKVKPLQKPDERYGIVYQAGGLYFHAMWIHAFGGVIFDDNHVPAFDSPGQLAALEYLRGLHMKDKVLPSGISGFMVTSLFNEGNAAVVFNGPWFTAEIQGVDYGIATIPTVQGKYPAPLLGIEAVFITKTSTKKDAALKAALYLAGAESAKTRMTVGKQPVCNAAVLAEGATSDPAMKVFMDQSEHAVLMDSSPEMQLLWTSADTAISAGIFVADRKPADELKKAQAKMVSDIGKAEKPQ